MPHKYPLLTPDELIRALRQYGFEFVSQRGSHCKYSDGKHVIIIPMHDIIARGTLRSILQMAGITLQQLLEVL